MKLIIKEIDRKNSRVVDKWTFYLTLEECLKRINELDNKFAKKHFKFKYEMIGE